MQLTKTHKIIISAIFVVILFSLYVFFFKKTSPDDTANNPVQVSTATSSDSGSKVITNPDGTTYTVEKITTGTAGVPKPIPDLDRPVTKSPLANVSEKDYTSASQKVKEFQTLLKRDPNLFPIWMDMAMYQNIAGDFEGAIISWKYAGRLDPKDFVSIANIGNTYAYYLKDNAQAETYYKLAISKGPTQVYLYYQLAVIYIDIFKDNDKARAIINQGLSKIPNDPSLTQLKDSIK